ncbi:MAG: hypothetical protein J6X30_01340 [Clostridia bacterium]|nr:hypothetical protein [Clostridia bacterium]
MKRFLALAITLLLLVGCKPAAEPLPQAPHTVMDGMAITLPADASPFAKAIYEATDRAVNTFLDETVKKKPEFISFDFSSDVMLTEAEKQELLRLFACYGVEITEGLRSSMADMDRGITVAYASIEATQTGDCDLTIPVKLYFGKYIYTYCADFIKENERYILFRFEHLHVERYFF